MYLTAARALIDGDITGEVDALLPALWTFEQTDDLRALLGRFALPGG
ncbi:hypothetical protein [Reyranella sp.]|jgi:hypothetical protein